MNDIGMACGLAERIRNKYEEQNLKIMFSTAKYQDLMKATVSEWERWFKTPTKIGKEVIEMGKCCGGKKGCKGGGKKSK